MHLYSCCSANSKIIASWTKEEPHLNVNPWLSVSGLPQVRRGARAAPRTQALVGCLAALCACPQMRTTSDRGYDGGLRDRPRTNIHPRSARRQGGRRGHLAPTLVGEDHRCQYLVVAILPDLYTTPGTRTFAPSEKFATEALRLGCLIPVCGPGSHNVAHLFTAAWNTSSVHYQLVLLLSFSSCFYSFSSSSYSFYSYSSSTALILFVKYFTDLT